MPRILLVDDDEAYRTVIKEHLLGTYNVIDTGVPEAALAMTLEHKPDAILLDLSMPGLSGFELCHVLSSLSITEQIPIFIVTGEDERNKAFCQNLGASEYFTKPIDFAKLKTALEWALGVKKTERRAEGRINLRVMLKLSGKNKEGASWEARAATENMSRSGFLCACTPLLAEDVIVEVCLCGEREYPLGPARLVRVVMTDDLNPRYGFQFIGRDSSQLGKT